MNDDGCHFKIHFCLPESLIFLKTFFFSFFANTIIHGNTLCSRFMRFRFMRFSIYAVLGNGPYSCFMQQFSHIVRFLVKIIVHKILVIFILHLCYSCITRFSLGNKKCINGELSVFESTSNTKPPKLITPKS